MTHLSRKKVPENTINILKKSTEYIFSKLKPKEFDGIANTLLTETERKMLYKRIGIIYLLKNKVPEIEIADILKTTRQTVARIRLQLQTIPAKEKDILLKKLHSWKNISTLKSLVKKSTIIVTKALFQGKRIYKH